MALVMYFTYTTSPESANTILSHIPMYDTDASASLSVSIEHDTMPQINATRANVVRNCFLIVFSFLVFTLQSYNFKSKGQSIATYFFHKSSKKGATESQKS